MMQYKENNPLYSVEAIEIKEASRKWNAAAISQNSPKILTPFPQEAFDKSIARIKEIYNNISKIVDENGEPLVVYHWTDNIFDTFQSGNSAGTIYFSEDKIGAKKAARGKKHVMECFLSVKNPVNEKENSAHWYDAEESLKVNQWREERYDGLFVRDEAGISIAVFSNTQIKSAANNNGQFAESFVNAKEAFSYYIKNISQGDDDTVCVEAVAKVMKSSFKPSRTEMMRIIQEFAPKASSYPPGDYALSIMKKVNETDPEILREREASEETALKK